MAAGERGGRGRALYRMCLVAHRKVVCIETGRGTYFNITGMLLLQVYSGPGRVLGRMGRGKNGPGPFHNYCNKFTLWEGITDGSQLDNLGLYYIH